MIFVDKRQLCGQGPALGSVKLRENWLTALITTPPLLPGRDKQELLSSSLLSSQAPDLQLSTKFFLLLVPALAIL